VNLIALVACLAHPAFAGFLGSFACIKSFVHFFCSSKRNEPKKKSPKMPTSAFLSAHYTSLNGATKKSAVRTIFGFAPAPLFLKWILKGLREFWEKVTVLRLAARACCKQYCLSAPQ
jgi:hypothetical protein